MLLSSKRIVDFCKLLLKPACESIAVVALPHNVFRLKNARIFGPPIQPLSHFVAQISRGVGDTVRKNLWRGRRISPAFNLTCCTTDRAIHG